MPSSVIVNPITWFRILQRNIDRTPPGSEVRICKMENGFCNANANNNVLKPIENDRCIAFSYDVEDLVLLAVEHEWWFSGPPELVDLANSLNA